MLRCLFVCLSLLAAPARAEPPRIVTDIAPVHGLVAMVLDGVATPDLVVPPGSSPHHVALRPSDVRVLGQAAAIVWVGPALTPWLAEAIETHAPGADMLTLMELDGVTLLPMRDSPVFADIDHDHDHDHGNDHDHETETMDSHLWLDPDNAVLFVRAIAHLAARLDPQNGAIYEANAIDAVTRISETSQEVAARLSPVSDQPFLMLHDGLAYFETHFALNALGAVTGGDDTSPGAARLTDLQAALRRTPPRCAFSAPGADSRPLDAVTEGLDVQIATLDPLGAAIRPGPAHYPALLRALGQGVADCLGR